MCTRNSWPQVWLLTLPRTAWHRWKQATCDLTGFADPLHHPEHQDVLEWARFNQHNYIILRPHCLCFTTRLLYFFVPERNPDFVYKCYLHYFLTYLYSTGDRICETLRIWRSSTSSETLVNKGLGKIWHLYSHTSLGKLSIKANGTLNFIFFFNLTLISQVHCFRGSW